MKVQIYHNRSDLNKFNAVLLKVADWIAGKLDLNVASADIILTDDPTLRKMHKEYLDDNTLTDVMTFNLSDSAALEAEIYISVDRVIQNTSRFKTTIRNELMRLIIHAFLHLAGYDDQSENKRRLMKSKEDTFLLEAEGIFPP